MSDGSGEAWQGCCIQGGFPPTIDAQYELRLGDNRSKLSFHGGQDIHHVVLQDLSTKHSFSKLTCQKVTTTTTSKLITDPTSKLMSTSMSNGIQGSLVQLHPWRALFHQDITLPQIGELSYDALRQVWGRNGEQALTPSQPQT